MDDEDFGSDDLDLIPDDTLQQLEQAAFTATQQARTGAIRNPTRSGIHVYGTTGLSRHHVPSKNGNEWRPPQPRNLNLQQPVRTGPPASAPDPPSSDYGFDDEDVIDLDEPTGALQSTSVLPNRGRTETPAPQVVRSFRDGYKRAVDPETEAAFAAADAEMAGSDAGQWAQAPHPQPKKADDGDAAALRAQLAEVQAENMRLAQSEAEARRERMAKEGEAAIMRSKYDKAIKEHERQMSITKRQHDDELAKHRAELEATKKQREKMETDNRFLQHDLAQEAERAKRLTVPGKTRTVPGLTRTPSKQRRSGLGDGFDDDEVRIVSPSASRDKSRDHTPKVGAKRKRTAQESPVGPLSFSQPKRTESIEQPQPVVHPQVTQEQSKYAFMQRTLNHRPYEGHQRTVEALTKYAYPSKAQESLSSILLNALTLHSPSADSNLRLKLARTTLGLWRRCLEEEYYQPLYLLLDFVKFALRNELSSTICELIKEAVPICVRTVNLVTGVVFQASTYPNFVNSPEYEAAQKDIAPYIDVDEVMDFLKLLCDAATLDQEAIQLFWRTVDFKSLLLMLSKAQPISRITSALHLLATSCLPTSFGCICNAAAEDGAQAQSQQEKSMIERLTSMLFELPLVPNDEPPYTDQETLQLRLEVLQVLKDLCQHDHGGLLLAQYRTAIGRLIRFLDIQVSRLYTTRPAVGLSLLTDEKPLHSLVADTVNLTVRLVYHLLRTHSEVINMQQKLAVIKGGWHKFLISMTRIAFSDRLVFEEGLDEESVEAAHQILDSVLSPEEGEAVVRAVETPRGTKGTLTELNTESEGDDQVMENG